MPQLTIDLQSDTSVTEPIGVGRANLLSVILHAHSIGSAVVKIQWSPNGRYWVDRDTTSVLKSTNIGLRGVTLLGEQWIRFAVSTSDATADDEAIIDYELRQSSPFDLASGGGLEVTASGGISTLDFGVEVALGNVSGYSKINKFGAAPDCDSGVATDVWDGADGTTSTDVWVAPTTARVHQVTSTSANDTSAGTGLRTCKVFGLTGWGTAEVSETVTMNGTSDVATANSYVIVHRITGITFGSGGTNAGIVTATADTDGTVTAAIQTGKGQTLMAIYGVPSTQTLHLKFIGTDILRSVSSVTADGTLLVKENADQSTAGFVTKERWLFQSTEAFRRQYPIPKSFTGPCIVKIQVEASTNNSNATGSFDAYLVDN